jgi:hypothetical protein
MDWFTLPIDEWFSEGYAMLAQQAIDGLVVSISFINFHPSISQCPGLKHEAINRQTADS